MIRNLFRKRPREDVLPRVPDGERVYAIGDIHGRIDLLNDILARIDADDAKRPPAQTHLILLGDLLNRGPASAEVIDRLVRLRNAAADVRVLMGNHEEVFLRGLDGNVPALRLLLKIGGAATLLSYGVTQEQYDTCNFSELLAVLDTLVPVSHRRFLAGLEDMIEIGDYLFVHAGIRPGMQFIEQVPADLRWMREPFLSSKADHGKVVVHGHNISIKPEIRANRIGIDTGAYVSGRLTALGLQGTEQWFLTTGE